jgi:endonuclease YncB( thermonuclease family)
MSPRTVVAVLAALVLAVGLPGGAGPAATAAPPPTRPVTADQPKEPQPAKGERWRERGTVVRVVDGDTVDLQIGAQVQRVRMNGIQAPEKRWCGGKRATQALAALLPKGTEVRLASRRAKSGNNVTGVWRLKRTVHVQVDGRWTDIAPDLLAKGLVFPFPFIGEDVHNDEYLALAWRASEQGVGLYDPQLCGRSGGAAGQRLRLEVVPDGPAGDSAGEFVMVFNGGTTAVDLSGWMVQDTSPLNAWYFPKGAVVRPDDYVVVFSGEGKRGRAPDGSKDPRFFHTGASQRWNDTSADIAFLFDDTGKGLTGNLRAWHIVTPE